MEPEDIARFEQIAGDFDKNQPDMFLNIHTWYEVLGLQTFADYDKHKYEERTDHIEKLNDLDKKDKILRCLNKANTVISNPNSKRVYDAQLKLSLKQSFKSTIRNYVEVDKILDEKEEKAVHEKGILIGLGKKEIDDLINELLKETGAKRKDDTKQKDVPILTIVSKKSFELSNTNRQCEVTLVNTSEAFTEVNAKWSKEWLEVKPKHFFVGKSPQKVSIIVYPNRIHNSDTNFQGSDSVKFTYLSAKSTKVENALVNFTIGEQYFFENKFSKKVAAITGLIGSLLYLFFFINKELPFILLAGIIVIYIGIYFYAFLKIDYYSASVYIKDKFRELKRINKLVGRNNSIQVLNLDEQKFLLKTFWAFLLSIIFILFIIFLILQVDKLIICPLIVIGCLGIFFISKLLYRKLSILKVKRLTWTISLIFIILTLIFFWKYSNFSFRTISEPKIKTIQNQITITPEYAENISDIQGNIYKTIKIGTQTWMAENLKTTKLNDGITIPEVKDVKIWVSMSRPGYCWYENDINKYKDTYGALYNGYAVETGKLCPVGWHVPTDEEWSNLIDNFGGLASAGEKLKETGIIHWNSPNTGATNESNFSVLPGGTRILDGKFRYLGEFGHLWSSTEYTDNTKTLRARDFNYYNSEVGWIAYYKNSGLSVRCIKDN